MSVLRREKLVEQIFDLETCCLECGKPVVIMVEGEPWLNLGGYSQGNAGVYLCQYCAKYSNLHVMGYLIGDALMSNYETWKTMRYRDSMTSTVDKIVDQLRSSIFRALLVQLDSPSDKQ